MSEMGRREHEVAILIMAAVVGEASQEDLKQLNQWIEENQELGEFVVELMAQEAWLTWSGASARTGDFRRELAEHISQIIHEARTVGLPAGALTPSQLCGGIMASGSAAFDSHDDFGVRGQSRVILAMAASVLVATGAILGWLGSRWYADSADDALMQFAGGESSPDASGKYVARLVQGTACLWTPESAMLPGSNEMLRSGESLRLLEGVAEVRLDWTNGGADLQIEGPAGLVLTAERGASLSHGKFTVDINLFGDSFVLDTPNGEVELSGEASVGIAVVSGDVEIHVFSGSATFLAPWSSGNKSTDRIGISAGKSLKVAVNTDGRMEAIDGKAQSGLFASKLSMGSDNLVISGRYVSEVLSDHPLIYWRFEGNDNGVVQNTAGNRFNGRVVGSLEWLQQGGNRHIALGAGLTTEELQAFIVSEQPLPERFENGYSIEVWIKPSHYHWGTIVSMIGEPPHPGWQWTHGLLLEMGGPRSAGTAIERPGKVRFLHRDPPSDISEQGTSCFSQDSYQLRRWQHIVAIKDGAHMRLYQDGKLTATGNDPTTLAAGLKVLVGQLDEVRDYRRFVGQLDELAIYPRPLSVEEVRSHYNLVRDPDTSPATLQNRTF